MPLPGGPLRQDQNATDDADQQYPSFIDIETASALLSA
jgi:hypothetical protein